MKISKTNWVGGGAVWGWGLGVGSGWGGGGQGGWERRIEVLGKFTKKNSGGGGRVGWGARVDVNEELKFL